MKRHERREVAVPGINVGIRLQRKKGKIGHAEAHAGITNESHQTSEEENAKKGHLHTRHCAVPLRKTAVGINDWPAGVRKLLERLLRQGRQAGA